MESGAAPAPAQTKYTAQVKVDLVSNMKELLDNIDLKKKQVVDARSAGRFHGTEPEPRPGELLAGNPCLPTGQGLKGGHIPGSINVPYTEVLETKGAWRYDRTNANTDSLPLAAHCYQPPGCNNYSRRSVWM